MLLNQAVCDHLFRQGRLDIAKTLIDEAGLEISAEHIEKFADIHRILEALKQQDVRPAMEWAENNRASLEANKSPLHFKLHRLEYLSLLSSGQTQEALAYAKNLQPYITEHTRGETCVCVCVCVCAHVCVCMCARTCVCMGCHSGHPSLA